MCLRYWAASFSGRRCGIWPWVKFGSRASGRSSAYGSDGRCRKRAGLFLEDGGVFPLFNALRDWCAGWAKREGARPYLIRNSMQLPEPYPLALRGRAGSVASKCLDLGHNLRGDLRVVSPNPLWHQKKFD